MPQAAKPKAKAKPKATAKPKAKAAAGKSAKAAAAPMKFGPRGDLGAPVDGFFARQPPHIRPIVDQLRALIGEAAPEAQSSIKWGMPFYEIAGNTVCAIGAFKQHVNLILPGPPGTYADPDGRLEGDGKTGKHLKLRSADELAPSAVRGWLKTAAARARV
ncbi:MAG TPA: DUF1801 domain-containing protein [Polyangia bacterium]|nr:DUF1801 domain-containing protein [Polyangia bacterium]